MLAIIPPAPQAVGASGPGICEREQVRDSEIKPHRFPAVNPFCFRLLIWRLQRCGKTCLLKALEHVAKKGN